MGIFSSLFGSQGGYPSWLQDMVRGGYGDYSAAIDQAYGPDAYRRDVGMFNENLDRNYQNLNGQAYNHLSAAGVRPDHAGHFYDMTRAADLAHFQSDDANRLAQGRLGALQGRQNMAMGMAPLFYKQATNGIMGQIGSLAGQYFGAAAMSKGGQQQPQGGGWMSSMLQAGGAGQPYSGGNGWGAPSGSPNYYTQGGSLNPQNPDWWTGV